MISGKSSPYLSKIFQNNFKTTMLSVLVPHTPNPTTGFFFMVPEDEVKELDISTEDAFKLIISFGIVTPDTHKLEKGAPSTQHP